MRCLPRKKVLLAISLLVCVAVAAHNGARCTTSEGCSFNGDCETLDQQGRILLNVFLPIVGWYVQNAIPKQCTCWPGWKGGRCDVLDLAPAQRGRGYNWTTPVDEDDRDAFGLFGNSLQGAPSSKGLSRRRAFEEDQDDFGSLGKSPWGEGMTPNRANVGPSRDLLRGAQRSKEFNQMNTFEEDRDDFGPFGNSSWGGTIIHDRDNPRLFHLIHTQIAHGCGLDSKRPHAMVVRSESRRGPRGPYHYKQTLLPTYADDPYIYWDDNFKQYFMFTVGENVAIKGDSCMSLDEGQMPSNISVSAASNIRGPWTEPKMILSSLDPLSANPTALTVHENLKLALPDDGVPDNSSLRVVLGVQSNAFFMGSSWDGDYKLVKKIQGEAFNASTWASTWTDDPFVWRDKKGNWHSLNHWKGDSQGPRNNSDRHDTQVWGNRGVHLFSKGKEWHEGLRDMEDSKKQPTYSSTATFEDGLDIMFKRREKPRIFFSDDEGQNNKKGWDGVLPLYLVTAVEEFDRPGASYTFIQPIGDKWKEYERKLGFVVDD